MTLPFTLDETTLAVIGAAVALQFAMGGIYYGIVMAAPWRRYAAIDKGVKDFHAHTKIRFSATIVVHATLLAALCRCVAMLWIVPFVTAFHHHGAPSLFVALEATLFASALVFSRLHDWVWNQRPLGLILIEFVGEVLLYFCAAVAVIATPTLTFQ